MGNDDWDLSNDLNSLDGMEREELLMRARKWCYEAHEMRRQRDAQIPAANELIADTNKRLTRVWALADVRRKTVRMDDLLNAMKLPGEI